jgi:hypothetical protein
MVVALLLVASVWGVLNGQTFSDNTADVFLHDGWGTHLRVPTSRIISVGQMVRTSSLSMCRVVVYGV